MNAAKAMARRVLQQTGLYGWYSLKKRGPLLEDGWFRSFQEKRPVDAEGNPIPFFTYPAIEFLKRRIRPEMTVFEYGSGMSTLWWASRVQRVDAVEHDPQWFELLRQQAPENTQIHFAPIEDRETYPRKILESTQHFSVVVIDGRLRVRCARAAVGALADDGVIIWDNSDREYYQPGFEFLKQQGFRRVEFTGPCPSINEKSETSIFYRCGDCLEL